MFGFEYLLITLFALAIFVALFLIRIGGTNGPTFGVSLVVSVVLLPAILVSGVGQPNSLDDQRVAEFVKSAPLEKLSIWKMEPSCVIYYEGRPVAPNAVRRQTIRAWQGKFSPTYNLDELHKQYVKREVENEN